MSVSNTLSEEFLHISISSSLRSGTCAIRRNAWLLDKTGWCHAPHTLPSCVRLHMCTVAGNLPTFGQQITALLPQCLRVHHSQYITAQELWGYSFQWCPQIFCLHLPSLGYKRISKKKKKNKEIDLYVMFLPRPWSWLSLQQRNEYQDKAWKARKADNLVAICRKIV